MLGNVLNECFTSYQECFQYNYFKSLKNGLHLNVIKGNLSNLMVVILYFLNFKSNLLNLIVIKNSFPICFFYTYAMYNCSILICL